MSAWISTRPGSPAPPPLPAADYDTLEAYDFAQFTHAHAGRYFPSLSELQRTTEPRTMPEIKAHLDDMKERYTQDLDALIDDQVERYYEDALDRYHSYDPTLVPNADDPEQWPREYTDNKFKSIYHDQNFHRSNPLMSRFNTELATNLIAHNDRQKPYLEKLKRLEEHEKARLQREKAQAEQARLLAEKKFPRTIQEWENHSQATRKLWLARFLTFTLAEKEENMKKQTPPWTWEDVDPLCNMYKADASFRERIQKFIQSHGSTDPRRKPVA